MSRQIGYICCFTLSVRPLVMTMKIQSRVIAILSRLGAIKVGQLAITTAILSRVIIFRLGPLTLTHQTRNPAILCSNGCPTGMIQLGTFTITQLTHEHRLRHRTRLRRVSQSHRLTGVHEGRNSALRLAPLAVRPASRRGPLCQLLPPLPPPAAFPGLRYLCPGATRARS